MNRLNTSIPVCIKMYAKNRKCCADVCFFAGGKNKKKVTTPFWGLWGPLYKVSPRDIFERSEMHFFFAS